MVSIKNYEFCIEKLQKLKFSEFAKIALRIFDLNIQISYFFLLDIEVEFHFGFHSDFTNFQ